MRATSLRFNRAKLKTIASCCVACFWPVWAPHRSYPMSLLDPCCSGGKAEARLCRQTAQLKRGPLHAYLCSFHSRRCVGTVLSKPQGTGVGERRIGLIYVRGEAAGRFNDPPYRRYHRDFVLVRSYKCHENTPRIMARSIRLRRTPARPELDSFPNTRMEHFREKLDIHSSLSH